MADKAFVAEVTDQLSAIFRHMLPGVLVVGSARLAHPGWFRGSVGLDSWEHIFVWGVLTLAVGNAWFALNRYGLHQLLDLFFYQMGWEGPTAKVGGTGYIFNLGFYTYKSLHTAKDSERARRHIQFRASAVLLILTIGELGLLLAVWPGEFERWRWCLLLAGLLVFVVGCWQKVITRRIDSFVVNAGEASGPRFGNADVSTEQPRAGNSAE